MGLVYDQKPTQIVDEILHRFPKIWPQLLSIPTEEMKKTKFKLNKCLCHQFWEIFISYFEKFGSLISVWDIKKDMTKGEDEHEADLQHSPKKAIISLLFEEYNQNGARSRLNWSSAFSRNLNH